MKKFLPLLGLTILVIVGAGCKKDTPDPKAIEAARVTREQQAYVYCTNKKFTPQVRFDGEVNRNRLFCVFESGNECDAIEFMDGKCTQETSQGESDINTSLTPPGERFTCEPIAKPVCGTDNKTYTNRCTAESQGKKVKYEGVCSEVDEPFEHEQPKNVNNTVTKPAPDQTSDGPRYDSSRPLRPRQPRPSQNTEPSTSVPTPPIDSSPSPNTSSDTATAEWIGNLTSLLQNSSSPYPISFSECREGSRTYYYQKEECTNCFKILYSSSGESLCYPGMNDEACPQWNERNCKIIWKK